MSKMKIALVHDWLTGMRGGEKVLEVFCQLLPSADIFTLLHLPGSVSEQIEKHKIITSFLQKMPLVKKKYRYYLPLMPCAIESLDLSEYDVIISSSHCVAKGCKLRKDAIHICYCHTPMRYIWDQFENYFGRTQASLVVRFAMKLVRPYLQNWDVKSSERVSYFIANSSHVKERIKNYFDRDSTVIYPPVDTNFYVPPDSSNANSINKNNLDYYLIVTALAPYKRIDIAIEAFNQSGKKLKIVGSGQYKIKLQSLAKSNIEFLGWMPNEKILSYYQGCKALIFPTKEDFGIVPVETMSCGKPVIAFRGGGALETIIENKTGIFFNEQNSHSLQKAVDNFEQMGWDSEAIRNYALKFSKQEFVKNTVNFLRHYIANIDLKTTI